jgi:hypothetical protein
VISFSYWSIKLWFYTEGKLAVVLIIPSSWGFLTGPLRHQSSLWKCVKRHGLLLHGACEVVLELAISGVEEKLAIRRSTIFVRGKEKKVSLGGVRGSSVVTHTSPTVINLLASK